MAKRGAVLAPLAHRVSAIEPNHLRVDARLIQKDQALRIDERLRCSSQFALCRDVRVTLFARAEGFC